MARRDDDLQLADAVRALAEPLAAAHGIEVLEVRVSGGGRRLVRVTVDATEPDADGGDLDAAPGPTPGGLDIDAVAALSRALGAALDEQDVVADAYDLEVSSPGADRPLTRPRDFARNVGRKVEVVLADGDARHVGTLVTVAATDLTLEVGGAEVIVPLVDVDHGTVVLPW